MTKIGTDDAARAWDVEYAAGRYRDDPPLPFVADIVAAAHEHVRAAQARLRPAGLFCLRVNAVGTELEYAHDVIERDADGGFTVRYVAGPKAGLNVRFFAGAELC